MGEFLHQLASGLALGGVYAIMALALVMIYQATHLINFAQGEMAMFSTYFAWKLMDLGEPYWFAFFATVVASFIGGVVIERLVVRPFANAPILASVIVFIGLSLIFNSLAGWLYGFSVTSFDSPFTGRPWFGAGYMSAHEAGAVVVTLCVLALVYAFFRLTPLGLAMRAAAQNPVSSRLVGIRVGWMLAIGWGLAAAIGSVAGMMAAPIVYLDPNMMGGVLLYAFAGAVLGGIDNPFGAVFGGVAVGVLGNLIGAYRGGRRGQALGRACDHHRRARLAAVRTVRAPPRGEGLTMADADGALGALVAIAVGVFALAFPFVASGYHIYQGAQVLILADRAARPQSADRLQRPDLARPRRVFRHRRLRRGDPDGEVRPAVLGGHPAGQRRVLHRRLSVRLSRAQVRRPLSRARHLRARRRNPADPELQGLRRTHRRLAGPHAREAAARHSGLELTADQWLYLVCLACAAALYWAARNLVRGRVGRALVAIRDQPIAAETMGINAALYKTTCFGVSALYAGVAGGLSAIAVGFVSPESFGLALSLAFLVGIVVGGLASLGGALFGALFIEFVPNIADQLTVSFGEGAKALPGAIYGVLLILVMAAMPTGAAGAARAAARALASSRQAKVEKTAAPTSPQITKEREKRHDHSTDISAIERRRRGLRRQRRFRPRRQCARRHRHRDQDRADHAL